MAPKSNKMENKNSFLVTIRETNRKGIETQSKRKTTESIRLNDEGRDAISPFITFCSCPTVTIFCGMRKTLVVIRPFPAPYRCHHGQINESIISRETAKSIREGKEIFLRRNKIPRKMMNITHINSK